jgi:Ca2+-transporting ATPase
LNDVSQGLTSSEAAARLKAEGYNELPEAGGRSIFRPIGDVLREPFPPAG